MISCNFLFFILTLQIVIIHYAESNNLYNIDGTLYPPIHLNAERRAAWLRNTVINVKGGEYKGVLKEDGSFTVYNVPAGTYVVEIISDEFLFEPARVDITTSGKFRARRVNYVQTSQVIQLPYPLKIKALGITQYFHAREQWRITDLLMNPMILMMIVPFFILMVLPRMIDSELKQESEQQHHSNRSEITENSESRSSACPPLASNSARSIKQKKNK